MRFNRKQCLMGLGVFAVGGCMLGFGSGHVKGEGHGLRGGHGNDFGHINVSTAGFVGEVDVDVDVDDYEAMNVKVFSGEARYEDYIVLKFDDKHPGKAKHHVIKFKDKHQGMKKDELMMKVMGFKKHLGILGLRGDQVKKVGGMFGDLHKEMLGVLTAEQKMKLEYGKQLLGDLKKMHHGKMMGGMTLHMKGHGGGHGKGLHRDMKMGHMKKLHKAHGGDMHKMHGLLMKNLGVTDEQKKAAGAVFAKFKVKVMAEVLDDDQRAYAEAYKKMVELKKVVYSKKGIIYFGKKDKKHGLHLKHGIHLKQGAGHGGHGAKIMKLKGHGGHDFMSQGHMDGLHKFVKGKFKKFDLKLTDEQRKAMGELKTELSVKMRELLDEGQVKIFDEHEKMKKEFHGMLKKFDGAKGQLHEHIVEIKRELVKGEHHKGKKEGHSHGGGGHSH